MATNQAVVFTKPLHHLGLGVSPGRLGREVRAFLEAAGFEIVLDREVDGPDLAARGVVRRHYLMHSTASYGEMEVSAEGKSRFKAAFGKDWDAEAAAGRIPGNPQLMAGKGIDAAELFRLWDARFSSKRTVALQPGMAVAWIEDLGCFCVNAFYPSMEANFHHPGTRIDYLVVEFDPAQVSWRRFRHGVLGATDAAQAGPGSLRGRLYARFPVEHPGRDNFVHGSAGPLEGLVERTVHEPDFGLRDNPVGRFLAARGTTPGSFNAWLSRQPVAALGALYAATEDKDTDAAFPLLEGVIPPMPRPCARMARSRREPAGN